MQTKCNTLIHTDLTILYKCKSKKFSFFIHFHAHKTKLQLAIYDMIIKKLIQLLKIPLNKKNINQESLLITKNCE